MCIEVTAEYLKKIILNSERYINRERYIGEFFMIAATMDKRGRIISIGENSPSKTHPLMHKYCTKMKLKGKIYLHAELSALVKSFAKPHSILVIRINRSGKFAMAKPCPICMMAIKEAKIKKIWYSNKESGLTMIPGVYYDRY